MIIAVAILAGQQEREAHTKLFSDFAKQRGGRLLKGASIFDPFPEAGLTHAGKQVRLLESSSGGKHPVYYTEARLYIGPSNPLGYRLEIYPESFMSSIGKFFGIQDIEIGDSRFDSLFILQSNEEASLKKLLDGRTRMLILQLYELFGTNNIYLKMDNYWLVVKKDVRLSDQRRLEVFYDLSANFFDSVLEFMGAPTSLEDSAEAAGIHFITESCTTLQITEAKPICQVCGEEVTDDQNIVHCSYCRTPHHEDCWEYNGRCTIYGCRSTQCTRPAKKRIR